MYENIIKIAKPYLGPAAESFIARQCKSHLRIEPTALSKSDVKELAKWVGIGAGLIMDGAKAGELSGKIAALA
jgi:hypothetical protein